MTDQRESATTATGPAQGLVRWGNVSLQTAHLGFGGGLLVLLWVLLARFWGVEAFGAFNYLYAYAAFWGIVFDFGLDILITRLTASGSPRVAGWLLPVKAAVITLGGAVALGLGGILLPGQQDVLTVLLLGVALFSCTNFVNGSLRGLERLDIEARIGLGQKTGFFVFSAAGVALLDGGMAWVAWCYTLSQGAAFAASVIAARRLGVAVDLSQLSLSGRTTHLREIGWIWGVAALSFLGMRLDLFLLGSLLGDGAVGVYSAGFRIFEGFTLLGMAFMMGLFPRLAAAAKDPAHEAGIIRRAALLMAGAGLGLAIANALLAPWLMPLLFGAAWDADSATVLIRLGFVLPVGYTALLLGQAAMADARPRAYVVALAGGLAANLAVSSGAIAAFGVLGAVAGFFAREAVTAGLLLRTRLRRRQEAA